MKSMGMEFHFFSCTLGRTQKINQHSANSKFLEDCKILSLSSLLKIILKTWGCESASN